MSFRSLDKNGDWVFGNGIQAYATKNKAIGLDIETNLRTFLTECFFNFTIGIPWFDLLGSKDKTFFILTLKKAIASIEGVVNVDELEYSFDLNRQLSIKYEITTIYSDTYQGAVTI